MKDVNLSTKEGLIIGKDVSYQGQQYAKYVSYQGQQYSKYVRKALANIPLISLWDICFLVAKNMAYDGVVPDCIKGLDLKLIVEAIKYDADEAEVLLLPIQQWLSEQFIKSIDSKEIDPAVIGRFVDGKIDAKRTYIDEIQINEWFLCRGIDASCDDEDFDDAYRPLLMRVYDDLLNVSRLLSRNIYRPEIDVQYKTPRECSQSYLILCSNSVF